MRVLGLMLIVGTFLLVGGVATRPLADTEAAPAESTTAEPLRADPAPDSGDPIVDQALARPMASRTCGIPRPMRTVTIDLTNHEPPPGFVSLNRTGYNYRRQSDPPQIIPDSTGARKPEAVR